MPDNEREKIIRIFRYLKELDELRNPAVRNLKDHPVHFPLSDLPEHPGIVRGDTDVDDGERTLWLRVAMPDIACPSPPSGIESWLKPGWEEVDGGVEIRDEQEVPVPGGVVHRVFFTDDKERPKLLDQWKSKREAWAAGERAAREVYDRLVHIHSEMEKEGEDVDLLIGTAMVNKPEEGIDHPLLLQHVTLEFKADEPAFSIVPTEDPPEIYQPLLRSLPGVEASKLALVTRELREQAPDLASPEQTKAIVAKLSAAVSHPLAAGEVLIVRHRTLGFQRAVDRVLQDVEGGAVIPGALTRIVGLEDDEPTGTSPPSAEDARILLSKAANDEQLRIARRLERTDAVLVQGPPGTGKTHTIANLIGHLLAEGKSVLVTAHTTKALRVVRDMVSAPLRPLCLTVLDNDADNRTQLNQAVQSIAARLTESDAEVLTQEASGLETRRQSILTELSKLKQSLFEARLAEAQPVVVGAEELTPTEAARLMKDGQGLHDWIPGSVTPAAAPPLTQIEASFLYESNALLKPEDERDLEGKLPDPQKLASASELAMMMAEQSRLAASAAQHRSELWVETDPPLSLEQLDAIQPRISAAANVIRGASGWWQEVVRAGRQGGVTRQIWEDLADQIEAVVKQADALHPALMQLDPQIQTPESDERDGDDVTLLSAICEHLQAGSSLGLWTKTTKRPWHRLIDRCKVGGKPPETLEHFQTLLAFAKLNADRDALRARWQRQVHSAGGPDASSLGLQPEKSALPIVHDIRDRLDWHGRQWTPLLADLSATGFQWDTYASGIVMDRNEFGDLARFRQAVSGGLPTVIRARRDSLRLKEVQASLNEFHANLQNGADSPVAQRLLAALADHDALTYSEISRDVMRLSSLKTAASKRRELLTRLEKDAPEWASRIRSRTSPHDSKQAPGDVFAAWRWKQISDQLQRRAQVDLQEMQTRSENLTLELHEVTAKLVEHRAWASKKQRVGSRQQAALEGYVGCLQKMTKSGRGRRDASLMAAAREHLKTARGAVPVWIMPLSRVYESFYSDETLARFDVVIIDEASQSDVSALTALYLGTQVIIVGDEEQVTPTPFADLDRVQRMINSTLEGVPNRELYDPETSVYHLARAFFRERILLREHFRSVPEIIQFSNDLSYEGNIRPLREAASSPLHPTLIAHRVKGSLNSKKVNVEEAEEIAALLMACLEQPEYDLNEQGQPSTFGVVSLLGNDQADYIENLLLARLSAAEFERRRIVCGNASQFQGDERDVMFISMVDVGEGTPQPMRGFGPKEIFRKRFNVAASRARNQMWVVHSLDVATDLQPGDLRRRLIDHCNNPATLMAGIVKPNRGTAMQRDVQAWLEEHRYEVSPQWAVGSCSVGLAVRQGAKHLAIECDGDSEMTAEALMHNAEKEVTLGRLGWTFVRVRASVFYRDADAAMQPVLKALQQAGITPMPEIAAKAPAASDLLERVMRRAPEIKWMWSQRARQRVAEPKQEPVVVPKTTAAPVVIPAAAGGVGAATSTSGCVVEVGDWVEFVLTDAPNDPQYVNIISGPTDVEQSFINAEEPLARALLGHGVHEKGILKLGDVASELEVLQIHKPRKHPGK